MLDLKYPLTFITSTEERNMSYTIKEVAKMMGAKPSTLHYYDTEGLLPNIKRVNGIRIFDDKDFKWLRILNCLKKTNMPLKKIKEYVELAKLGDETLNDRLSLITEQKAKILNDIKTYQYFLKEIEYKEWYLKEALRLGDEKALLDSLPDKAGFELDKIPETKTKVQNGKY